MDDRKIQSFLVEQGGDWIRWHKNPPLASHIKYVQGENGVKNFGLFKFTYFMDRLLEQKHSAHSPLPPSRVRGEPEFGGFEF